VVLAALGFWLYQSQKSTSETPLFVTNFEECAGAGYPVMESNPRQCRTPNGTLFTEETGNDDGEVKGVATGGCFIGGCSSQICSDVSDVVSTCEYRTDYVCYQSGRCERQAGGECGWTQTPELLQCLNFDWDALSK
jgi:hypothetical protein